MKLNLENISVELGGKTILKRINFGIEKNTFTSLLGPSGCGKSTLLKTIAGFIPCKEGLLYINGKNAESIPPHKRKAVIVFQDIRLFPHMSVEENIGYPLKISGQRNYGEVVRGLLKQVHLEGYENMPPDKLSGGEAQRVALARALAAKPEILLLDEPFASLDENLRFDMGLLVNRLHREHNMTTIMVTHNKEEALSMSDIVMVMNSGSILQTGTPRELYENPSSLAVAKYFGNGVFLRGFVKNGKFYSKEFIFDCPAEDGDFTLMIRYDALQPEPGKDFKLLHTIYSGSNEELLFEHRETKLRILCPKFMGIDLNENAETSFKLDVGKVKLFIPASENIF